MTADNLLEFIVSLMYNVLEWGNELLSELSVERQIVGFENPISLLEIMFGFGVGIVIVRIIRSFFG